MLLYISKGRWRNTGSSSSWNPGILTMMSCHFYKIAIVAGVSMIRINIAGSKSVESVE